MKGKAKGRPKKASKDRRSATLRIRMTPAERAMFDESAKRAHLDVSSWARSVLSIEAKKLGVSEAESSTRR